MTNEEYLKGLLENLKKPIPHQWRVQSHSKTKAQATVMAYIDQRDLMDVLDKYCIYGWQKRYEEIAGNLFCYIGINMPDGTVHWRSDCGVESNQDAEKGRASDAAKRAGVNWGVGRFLYDMKIQYVTTDKIKAPGNYPNCIDENGKIIYDLTKYINDKNNRTAPQAPQQPAPVQHPILKPGNDKWAACVKGIADGIATIEKIRLKNTLSDEHAKQMLREAEILKQEQAATI